MPRCVENSYVPLADLSLMLMYGVELSEDAITIINSCMQFLHRSNGSNANSGHSRHQKRMQVPFQDFHLFTFLISCKYSEKVYGFIVSSFVSAPRCRDQGDDLEIDGRKRAEDPSTAPPRDW